MNVETARDVYDNFDDAQKAKAKALIKGGLDRIKAVRQVHAGNLGDVTRAAQPDLDVAESDPSFLENAAVGVQQAGKSLAFGLDDEVAGGLGAAASIFDGVPNNAFDAYEKGRDNQRDQNDSIRRLAPEAAGTGEVAATLGSVLLPGGKVAKAATSAPRLGRAVLEGLGIGAGTGAVAGYGQDEGNVGENTVTGSLFGGALGVLLGGGGAAVANRAARNSTADAAGELAARGRQGFENASLSDVIETAGGDAGKRAVTTFRKWFPEKPPDFLTGVADDMVPGAPQASGLDLARPRRAPATDPATPLDLDVAPFDPKAPPRFSNPGMSSMDELMQSRPPAGAGDEFDGLVDARMTPDSPAAVPEPVIGDDLDDLLDVEGMTAAADDLPDWMRQSRVEDWGTQPRPEGLGFDGRPVAPKPQPAPGGLSPDQGRAVRQAKEQARAMPAANPEGRQANQVRAIEEKSRLSAEFDALPPEMRSDMIARLQAGGMPDDVIRRRLGLTVAQWRRTSADRAGAAARQRLESNRADLVENLQSLQEAP